jgi:UDP-glucose 4-epimerase
VPFGAESAGGSQAGSALVVGLGFLGRHVAAALTARGQPTVVLTRSPPAADHIAGLGPLDLIVGDAADPAVTDNALRGVRHVIFCAGGLLPAHSELDPELDARLTLPPLRTVLAALRRRPAVSFTYLSSGGAIYGEPAHVPASEESATNPIGSYGRLRLVCEREIEVERHRFGLHARVLRCATVYGEHQRPDRGQGAVVTFLRRVESGEPIVVYGGRHNVRDYIYAGDVARIVVALLDRTEGPTVVNVGSGCGTSLVELVRHVEARVGRPADVIFQPKRPFDVRRIVLDTRRIRSLVDVELTGLTEGIERTHRWLVSTAPQIEVAS